MTWTNLSSAFGYGTKLTSANMQQLRDNVAAAFAKDTGAPELATGYIQAIMVAANQITLEKIQHGTVMPSFSMDSVATALSTASTAWVTAASFRGYIPTDATTLTMACRIATQHAPNGSYCRFVVGATNSPTASVTSETYAWITDCTLDVSALAGWQNVVIQQATSSTGSQALLQGFSFIWE